MIELCEVKAVVRRECLPELEKDQSEFLCRADGVERVVDVVRDCACTGERGDGVVMVSEIDEEEYARRMKILRDSAGEG